MKSDDAQHPIDAAISRLRATYTPAAGRPSEDVEFNELLNDDDADEYHAEPADELIWPPPGLEPVQGKLPRISYEFAAGAAILLFAFQWTGQAATALLFAAFLFLCFTYARVRQLLMHVSHAIGAGYPRALAWQVAADARGELPLVLQGKGVYTGITKAESMRIARLRVTGAALLMLSALWIPLIFPLITVLGFAGALKDVAVWGLLLVPPAVGVAAAIRLRVQEFQLRRKFRVREALDHETAAQVSGWRRLHLQIGWQPSRNKSTLEFRLGMAAVWLAAFFLLIPVALSVVMTLIPRFVASQAPSVGATVRSASLASLDGYRLPADSSLSAADAGRALHALLMTGRTASPSPLLQAGQPALPAIFPNTQYTRETNPEFWPDSLFTFTRRGLTPAQRTLVENAAAHPVNIQLARLARAHDIDIATTRWRLDMADSIPLHQLPLTHNRPVREAALAHIALASQQMQRGQSGAADTTLREIISAGFALRSTPPATEAVLGSLLIRTGGRALASLYEATGNVADAGSIRGALRTTDIAAAGASGRGAESIDELRRYVLRRTNPLPARWETFVLLQTAAPCVSFYSGIFGPDHAHKEWVAEARAALVRTSADSAYFELVSKGGASKRIETEPRCSPRVLRSYRAILMGY